MGKDWDHWIEDVKLVVQSIPKGKVTTYGLIAKAIGKPGAARMVGWVLNQCYHDIELPCHRVVNRMGMLTGKIHFPTPDAMENRLLAEGVTVQEGQINPLADYLWDPNIEK